MVVVLSRKIEINEQGRKSQVKTTKLNLRPCLNILLKVKKWKTGWERVPHRIWSAGTGDLED
jgi:hypothetical protein